MTSDEDETEDDRPEWYLKDTSVQFHRTPAEQDPAVGFFCKFVVDSLFVTQLFVVMSGLMEYGRSDGRTDVFGWEKRVGQMCGGLVKLSKRD